MAAMSKRKSDLLRRIVIRRFTEAMTEAIHLVGEPLEVIERELVPFWGRAVHDILIQVGACSCTACRDDPPPDSPCFMDVSPSGRMAMFPPHHPMSFAQFLEGYIMGRDMAFGELSGTAPEEEQ